MGDSSFVRASVAQPCGARACHSSWSPAVLVAGYEAPPLALQECLDMWCCFVLLRQGSPGLDVRGKDPSASASKSILVRSCANGLTGYHRAQMAMVPSPK